MACILREWGRLPIIIGNQHVRLLQVSLARFFFEPTAVLSTTTVLFLFQACQQSTEVNEGNMLLIQHCTPSLAAGGSSAGPGGAGGRTALSQTLNDYKTVFRSWQ